MIDPNNIPPVADNELLARLILTSNEMQADGTIKPKLFLPFSLVELSVNRHREATLEETWQVGREVASARVKTLYGLANIRASSCQIESLQVAAAPIFENPNHANISGYPPKKEDQMALAGKLAASIEGKWQLPPSDRHAPPLP